MGEDGELDELDGVVAAADDGVSALLDDGDPGVTGYVAEPHNLDWLRQPHVPDHQTVAAGGHHHVVGEHDQAAQTVSAGVDAVEEVTLVSLPHTQLLILTQADHTTWRVGHVCHWSIVCLRRIRKCKIFIINSTVYSVFT